MRWLHGDVVSSIGHGLVAVGCVLVCWFLVPRVTPIDAAGGAGTGYGLALGFYARREWENLRGWRDLPGWRKKAMKLADGWLDFMVPLVAGTAAVVVLA